MIFICLQDSSTSVCFRCQQGAGILLKCLWWKWPYHTWKCLGIFSAGMCFYIHHKKVQNIPITSSSEEKLCQGRMKYYVMKNWIRFAWSLMYNPKFHAKVFVKSWCLHFKEYYNFYLSQYRLIKLMNNVTNWYPMGNPSNLYILFKKYFLRLPWFLCWTSYHKCYFYPISAAFPSQSLCCTSCWHLEPVVSWL